MDKVALVTGGSKGIGYACAERLLAEGYEVAFCARNQAEIQSAAARLGGGDRVFGQRADVGLPEDCAGLVAAVTGRFGRIDVLVNNAGVYAPVPFLDFTADRWDALMHINVRGPVLLSVLAARAMRDRGGGRIVHIASTNGQLSEARVRPLQRVQGGTHLADQIHGGRTCAAGDPGQRGRPGLGADPAQRAVRSHPGRRSAGPDQSAAPGRPGRRGGRAVSFLCGPDASYITGITLNVDGGLTAMHPAV